MIEHKLGTALAVLSVLMLGIGVCSAMSLSLMWAFAIGIVPVLALGMLGRSSLAGLLFGAVRALWRFRGLFMIISLMGASIAMWLSSGAVAFLMERGAILTQGVFFLPAAFLVCAASSIAIGTALGTFSTIGLAFFGMGKAMGLPEPVVIGALVSGVFLADRIAPMSGLVNMMLRQADVGYREYLRHSWKRLLSVMAACVLFYAVAGLVIPVMVPEASAQNSLRGLFSSSPFLWCMPLLTVGLAVAGVPAVWTLLSGVLAGFAFTVFLQAKTALQAALFLLHGYSDESGLLGGGGIGGIAEVLGIVALAVCYNDLLSRTGITRTLLRHLADGVIGAPALKRRMALFSIGLTSLTCDQTVGILLPLEAMKPFEEDRVISRVEAALIVSDSGTLIAPLEFWNVNALVIFALTGVSALAYAPWALFCWLLPVLAILKPARANAK